MNMASDFNKGNKSLSTYKIPHIFSVNSADCCVEKARHTTVCFQFFALHSSKLFAKIRIQFLCGQVLKSECCNMKKFKG